jgi:hypothetical protein
MQSLQIGTVSINNENITPKQTLYWHPVAIYVRGHSWIVYLQIAWDCTSPPPFVLDLQIIHYIVIPRQPFVYFFPHMFEFFL